MIRTRFAPSPTGDPHIGNIRTALFAYLFAKKNGGEFLLRIEDTDRARHQEESIDGIKNALKWLNLIPDNFDRPKIQSEHLDHYKKIALELVDNGFAYVCNCSKERLDEVRKGQMEKGLPPGYDGHCREQNIPFGDNCVIRMKVPETGVTKFNDLIRGEVEFRNDTVDDQVILKSDGFPTYHLAHVVDDHEMQITHIIRAEEWLPSTPKHILLNQALGYDIPTYAHVPVILSPDHGKLSKRHGAFGILEYEKMGYLPGAITNFMVLLGWNPKTDQEFFSLDELERTFDLSQVNKAAAVFNVEKLDFFNHHYLMEKPADELVKLLDRDVVSKLPQRSREKIIDLAKDRMITLGDFEKVVGFLLVSPKIDPKLLVFKKSTPDITKTALAKTVEELENLQNWTSDEIKTILEQVVTSGKFSNGDVFWPVRYAISGEEKSPPPEEIAEVLGKEESLKRLNKAIELL